MAMFSSFLLVTILCLMSCEDVTAYATGAALSRCSSMRPGHGSAQNLNDNVYSITTSSNDYTPGGTVAVTLKGTSPFKGVLLQARDDNGNIVGTFSSPPSGLKTILCTNIDGAVTHSSRALKNDLTVQWNVPSDLTGSVTFRATFVKTFTQWWSPVLSNTLTASMPTTQAAAEATTKPETTFTESESTTEPESTTVSESDQPAFDEWSCDFEADLCGATQNENDILDWTWQTGGTPSVPTGPEAAFSGSYYLYIETSGKNFGDYAMLTLPHSLPAGKYCLTFAYHMYGFHVNELSVYVIYPSGQSQKIWMKKCQQGNVWIQTNLDFTVMDDAQVIFRASRGSGYASDIAIDNIRLEADECQMDYEPPSNLDILNCRY